MHLTDFNVAIHYSERRLHTSVAGSMAYMAPEVVGRKGYTWCVDWWSLGVVMWESLFHKRPFEGKTAERITDAILHETITLPDNADKRCSRSCQDFLVKVSCLWPRERRELRFPSSWTGITRRGLAAEVVAEEWRTCAIMTGCKAWIGKDCARRHCHHRSCQM